jgi:hypothetical protein
VSLEIICECEDKYTLKLRILTFFLLFFNSSRDIFLSFCPKNTINLFPDFLPWSSVYIKPNKIPANQLYIPVKMTNNSDTESGEKFPLVAEKSAVVKKLEPPVKVLRCCCPWKSCSCAVMDKKIVKNANAVLDKKDEQAAEDAEKEDFRKRIDEIEKSVKEILKQMERP